MKLLPVFLALVLTRFVAVAEAPATNTLGAVPPGTNEPAKPAKEYLTTTIIDPEKRELKPHDLLRFQIDQDPPVATGGEPMRVLISDGGEAMFPVSRHGDTYVKVVVSGKKLADLRKEVKALLDAEYYNDCSVILDLEQVNRNGAGGGDTFGSVTIYGELNQVVAIPDSKPLMLSDALLKAGAGSSQGGAIYADLKRVRIHREDPKTKRDVPLTVNVEKILKEGDRSADQQLRDGDRIEVREKGFNFFN
jgi:protein involved in polysaccharide export with SLBB domain